jgi:DNA-binding transcriptional ArsR family regulator
MLSSELIQRVPAIILFRNRMVTGSHTRDGAQALEALGDATRRKIVEVLRDGPCSVAQIARRLPVSRPAVSRHLRLMRAAGLVEFTAEGTRNVFRLRADGFRAIQAYVGEFWDDALAGFKLAVENDATSASPRRREKISLAGVE